MPLTCHRDRTLIDWEALANLIERAPLGTVAPEMVQAKFQGSFAVSFVTDGALLVGAGRAISDGVTSSAIYDVVVLPEYQGRGIGRMVMDDLQAQLPKASVMLVAVPGKEAFYRKLGFRRLTSAMLRKEDPASWIAAGYLEK